jgi:hypothetical protein
MYQRHIHILYQEILTQENKFPCNSLAIKERLRHVQLHCILLVTLLHNSDEIIKLKTAFLCVYLLVALFLKISLYCTSIASILFRLHFSALSIPVGVVVIVLPTAVLSPSVARLVHIARPRLWQVSLVNALHKFLEDIGSCCFTHASQNHVTHTSRFRSVLKDAADPLSAYRGPRRQ